MHGAGGRRRFLRGEGPPGFPGDAGEAAVVRGEHAGIDLHVVGPVVVQQIVVRVDRRHGVVDDHRVKVKGIGRDNPFITLSIDNLLIVI